MEPLLWGAEDSSWLSVRKRNRPSFDGAAHQPHPVGVEVRRSHRFRYLCLLATAGGKSEQQQQNGTHTDNGDCWDFENDPTTIIARRSATINGSGALMNRYVFCVFLLTYCLCLDPAEWLRIHGHVDSTTIIILYDPLIWLIDKGLMPEWLATWTLW